MQKCNIVFIGAGNMARGLIGGLIASGWDPQCLWATGPHSDKLERIKTDFVIHVSQSNQLGAQAADVIVFAVKPQILKTVATEVASIIKERQPLIISIAAGVREHDLRCWLGGKCAIVRCMPNMPALIRCGATALYANPDVSAEQKKLAETILQAVGITVWLNDESQLDTVTALSGSGPAYFFRVIEALEQAAIAHGLAPTTARLLTAQTALGAARIVLESEESLNVLCQQITSPGGTTEQALKVLAAGNITALFADALHAAQQRASELALLSGK